MSPESLLGRIKKKKCRSLARTSLLCQTALDSNTTRRQAGDRPIQPFKMKVSSYKTKKGEKSMNLTDNMHRSPLVKLR